ncbi:peptidase U35 phage prohead [Candidatus Termititenax aidoneus]|uniref:Peptidase U35 phage prohead n=1 Tax=Termititenax aidoneus TaxID=2218524 RepID=A0A388TCJ4_TERA1|nr:peptidase U35 phage prohead [Candidatus Termititenax aidoneus]
MVKQFEGTKIFEIADFKVSGGDNGAPVYITGYANTKGHADSYGDIPLNYNGQPVYDLSRHSKNPVFLADHYNSVGNIIGAFVYPDTHEDEKGLYFKVRLMENPQTDIAKHAVEAYKNGYARALSIGGKWLYENPENPNQLTKAYIYEISGVAIPADQDALTNAPSPKQLQSSKASADQLAELIREYGDAKVSDVMKKIKQTKEQANE